VRILFTIIDANMVGGHRVLLELMDKLRSGGAQLFAAFPGRGPLDAAVQRLGVQREFIPSWRLRDPRGYIALARVVARVRPDLIYTHCSGAGEFIGVAIGKAWRIPVVIHRHSVPGFGGGRVRQAIERTLMRWAYSGASAVIAVSDATYQGIINIGVSSARVKTVKNGISVRKFLPSSTHARALVRREFGLGEDSVVISLTGRLCENKGQRALMEAARRLPWRELKLRFLFVGRDQEQGGLYEAYLKRLACEYGLSDCVTFTGHRDQIADVLAASDVTVLPSNADACPISILESMAARKPVVATATTGACEILEDGISGLIVPIGDPNAFAQALLRLVKDSNLRASLAANAYERVSSQFRDDIMFRRVLAVLEAVAPKGSKATACEKSVAS
jgi:glycosyltransferase involved in cell wall biosynthesis